MTDFESRRDVHSFANPAQALVKHVDLDLAVDFSKKILAGTATLNVERNGDAPLVLDTRHLVIQKVEASNSSGAFSAVKWELGHEDPILGSPLTITLPSGSTQVRIRYQTQPDASGLQWLEPAQTAGKQHPFLFTQSQAIHARSWIPLQDSPGIRVTYSADIHVPKELMAVMSAEQDSSAVGSGLYHFAMLQPIPSYLIALSVGDLDFRPTGGRTGVYAERPVVVQAAKEFEDTEKMVEAVEQLYGPYRWGRYDLLVLPPSFPFGGMENPRLTFATPTVIAGDKSLVSLVAHELAHSWSGNLVTNATWSDFWLNEGFTTYLENRIQEAVYGKKQAEMELVLSKQDLDSELAEFAPRDQILHIDLKGRDPDDGATQVPYIKGALLLRQMEFAFGREEFDRFLRAYFDHFAFQSITTEDFRKYLQENLFDKHPDQARRIPLDQWITQPGLPPIEPLPVSVFAEVEQAASDWQQGKVKGAAIRVTGWSTQEWLRFLTKLPSTMTAQQMAELDHAFHFTQSGNSEILAQWLLMSVKSGYHAADTRLEQFLETVGRRKYIKPIYEELVKTPAGQARAKAIYAKARPMYHPISAATIDRIVK